MPEKNISKKESGIAIKHTLWFMISTAMKNKPQLLLIYLWKFVSRLINRTFLILIPKLVIDELMLIKGGEPIELHLKRAAFFAILYCTVNFITGLIDNGMNGYLNYLSCWFECYFGKLLGDKSMKMEFSYTEDPKVLELKAKAEDGISWYSGGVTGILNCFSESITNIFVLIGVSAVILTKCPILFPVQLIGIGLIAHFNRKMLDIETENYGKLSKINRLFGYFLFQLPDFHNGKEIRLYQSADLMMEKTNWYGDYSTGIWIDGNRRQRSPRFCMDLVNACRDGVSYFYLGVITLQKKISLGDFSMCVSSASELYQNMTGLVSQIQDLVKRCNYAYQFVKYMEYPDSRDMGEDAIFGGKHTIVFSNVSFKYPRSDKWVLENINLTVQSGEHLSVVGLNGAGKTTFIKLLCRLYPVTKGAILIDGKNINDYSYEEYQKLFAVVFQDFVLFAFSLKENITFGKDISKEEMTGIFELIGLAEDVEKLPQKEDTYLDKSFDENGVDLSGGQKQKAAIARALYKDAPIIILDEPTAALDPVAEYEIYRQFDTLVGSKTAIYISHRLSSCKFCDKIAVFSEGTIKEYGTHQELLNIKNGIYQEMFQAQAQYYVS